MDGVFTASAGGGKHWGDLFTHNYRLGPNYFNSAIIVNKPAYDKLSDAHKAKLEEVIKRIAPTVTSQFRKEEKEVTEKLKSKGLIVTEALDEDVKEAGKRMADFWDKWAESHGPEHMEALAKVRKAIGK